MFYRALEIATQAHKNQTRAKEPYIIHPKRVADQFNKSDHLNRTIAILHDVIEDAPEYLPHIRDEFPKEVLRAVMLLTRHDKQTYFDFVMKIRDSQNGNAIAVKIADLKDNMRDLDEGSKKDKYRFALYILKNLL